MAIFSRLKNMFGFSDADLESEIEDAGRDATVTPLKQRQSRALEPSAAGNDGGVEDEAAERATEMPDAVPDEIFEGVVRLFNESLPDFLKSTVDVGSQRKYIYDRLSESMKQYLEKLSVISDEKMQRVWETDRTRLNKEIESIREKTKKMEEANSEWKEQKLSAERQKRALSERVHDLEKQIDSFQAEKEQYELENKSLVNKLRAMQVQGDVSDETASMREDIETFKKRCEVADAMINDLNHKVASSRSELAGKDEEIRLLKEEIAAKPGNEEVDRLRGELDVMTGKLKTASEALGAKEEEIGAVKDELEEAQNALLQFEESLEKFENVKKNKDKRIAELQEELESRSNEVKEREAEIDGLKSTIENNLKMQAASEERLREEIDRLKRSGEYDRPHRRHSVAKPVPMDESLDNTDWLVATPPSGTSVSLSSITDEEFGYHEPKRRSAPDDPAQMSLW